MEWSETCPPKKFEMRYRKKSKKRIPTTKVRITMKMTKVRITMRMITKMRMKRKQKLPIVSQQDIQQELADVLQPHVQEALRAPQIVFHVQKHAYKQDLLDRNATSLLSMI